MVVIPVGRAGQKARRIIREEGLQRGCHAVREFVLRDPIPYVENENTPWSKYPTRLRKRLGLFGKEHDAELAYDGVKHSIFER